MTSGDVAALQKAIGKHEFTANQTRAMREARAKLTRLLVANKAAAARKAAESEWSVYGDTKARSNEASAVKPNDPMRGRSDASLPKANGMQKCCFASVDRRNSFKCAASCTTAQEEMHEAIQLRETGVHTWSQAAKRAIEIAPRPHAAAPAATCVVTFYTEDALPAWGRWAIELNANWARLHGYSYIAFLGTLVKPGYFMGWSSPRAMMIVMQLMHRCEWVFSLDGDAIVNRIEDPLAPIADAYLSNSSNGLPPPDILASCHYAQGHNGDCGLCSLCLRARNAGLQKCVRRDLSYRTTLIQSMKRQPHCAPNSGVLLARNTAVARSLIRRWAAFGGLRVQGE